MEHADPRARALESDRSPHEWHVYAIDRRSGDVLWTRQATSGRPSVQRHPENSYATATPATDGEHVVVLVATGGLFCYDIDGELLWDFDLGPLDAGATYDNAYQWGAASSPILWQGLVIVQADQQQGSFIAAFDINTGEQVWRTARDLISSFSTPTPISAHGLVYVTSRYRKRPIFAIRAGATGDISLAQGARSSEHVAWSSPRDGPYIATPLVYGEYLYVVSSNGVLTVFHAGTGERIYKRRIGEAGGAYSASPIAADGRIYLTSEDGDIFVIRAGPDYELLATNRMGEVCLATPFPAKLGTDVTLPFDAFEDGDLLANSGVRWQTFTNGVSAAALQLVDGGAAAAPSS